MTSLLTTITREASFDAGHRLMHQGGPCANLHGHHFRVQVSVSGQIQTKEATAEEGMVLDFARVKEALNSIVQEFDHAFIADKRDLEIIQLCQKSGWRLMILSCPPTAENLAALIYQKMEERLPDFQMEEVILWETPKNKARVKRKN